MWAMKNQLNGRELGRSLWDLITKFPVLYQKLKGKSTWQL